MKFKFFYKNLFLILAIDILLLVVSLYTAYLARFDFLIPQDYLFLFKKILPIVLFIKVICFYYFDLFRGMWRYTSLADLLNIIKASSVSTMFIMCYILLMYRFSGFSRSVFIIDWCFTIILIAGFRMSVRVYFVHFSEKKSLIFAIQKIWELLTRKPSNRSGKSAKSIH